MQTFNEIVLIGPFDVGKTTISRLVGQKLGLPVVSLDDVCYDYYREIGWNGPEAMRIYEQLGSEAFVDYTESFEPYGVEQILARNSDCVIDMGGCQTVSGNVVRFSRVKAALAPYRNVVLLLPSPDPEESVRILKTRSRRDISEDTVHNPCYYVLAKHIVYTAGKSLERIRDEVVDCTQSTL